MKKLLPFLFLLPVTFCFAQLVATPDTAICAGQAVQLNATGGSSYSWSPAVGLSNTNTANPVANPAITTTYIVSSPISATNLAVNGNFSLGNTGFTSNYTYQAPPNTFGLGAYWIGNNATSFSSGMSNCPDHTGNSGNMLIADGSSNTNEPVWCQTFNVLPNVTYNLSGWVQALNNINLPQARWMVNGILIGNTVNVFLGPCFWSNFTATWNSGVNTSATFCAVNPKTSSNGNDFAMDDFSITASGTMYDTITVNVNPIPTVNLGNDTVICNIQSLQLNAGNAGATYAWSNGSTNQTLSVTSPNNYSVTVTNGGNCTATDVLAVSNYALSVTASASNTTCGLYNGVANVSSTNGNAPFTYLWSTTETNDTIINLPAATYTVTVSDAAGCSATATTIINASTTGIVAIQTADTLICANAFANICAPNTFTTYLWNTGSSTACVLVSSPGNYTLTVTDNTGCTSISNQITITQYAQPTISVTVNDDTLQAFNGVNYQWNFNGDTISNENSDVYVATQSGNYTVLVTDTNGCSALSALIPITISSVNNLLPNVSVQVYPNPNSTGNWKLVVSNSLVGSALQITSITGQILFSGSVSSQESNLSLNLASGVYLLHLKSGNTATTKRMVRL